jgi:hypothetical protein
MVDSEPTAEGQYTDHRGRTPIAKSRSAESERFEETDSSHNRVSVSESLQDHAQDSDEPSEEVIRRTRSFRPSYKDDRLDLLDHWCPSERKCPSCRNGEWNVERGHAPSRSTRGPFAVARDDDRDRARRRLPPTGPRAEASGPGRYHPYNPSRRRLKETVDPRIREITVPLRDMERSRRPASPSQDTQKESEDMS